MKLCCTMYYRVPNIAISLWSIVDTNLLFCYCFTYVFMHHDMIMLYFSLPYFHVSKRNIFLRSTSVLSFYIDVVLNLSLKFYMCYKMSVSLLIIIQYVPYETHTHTLAYLDISVGCRCIYGVLKSACHIKPWCDVQYNIQQALRLQVTQQ